MKSRGLVKNLASQHEEKSVTTLPAHLRMWKILESIISLNVSLIKNLNNIKIPNNN